jgi:hypothetical protein
MRPGGTPLGIGNSLQSSLTPASKSGPRDGIRLQRSRLSGGRQNRRPRITWKITSPGSRVQSDGRRGVGESFVHLLCQWTLQGGGGDLCARRTPR